MPACRVKIGQRDRDKAVISRTEYSRARPFNVKMGAVVRAIGSLRLLRPVGAVPALH